jgi:DNA-binding LacI/PurR family transcriptional regulator
LKHEIFRLAIFAANDPAAIGAMAALNNAKIRVPEDVAIVGAGSIHYGDMLRVPLTTVAGPRWKWGKPQPNYCSNPLKRKSKARTRQVVVKPQLVIRQSCGAKIKTQ